MFKLVVLSALVAVAMAKPSLYHEVAAPIVAKSYVSPAAVSSTYREDIISKPAHIAYAAAAPVIAKTYVAEPVAVAAPAIVKTIAAPAAVSHTYREDIIQKPAAVAYAAPAVVAPVVAKTVIAPAYATYAAHAPVAYTSYAAHAPTVYAAPAVHAWFEQEFIDKEPTMDIVVEELIIRLGEDSDSETDLDEKDDDDHDDVNDGDLSGIEEIGENDEDQLTIKMYKLVVLSALVAVAVAKPSLYHEVAAPIVTKSYVAPAAVSHTYREDIISKPAHIAYAAPVIAEPVIAKTYVAEPVAVAAPAIVKTIAAPAAVSHTYREDIIQKPAAVAYAAPAVVAPVVAKTVIAPAYATYAAHTSYAAHAPTVYAAPAVHAW
ncbi:cuticle protein-like [Anthonomus grandis grandis]|uniref:cuticle protein-like n=1 Tax=Anthonomus grandis grandis TaxID=2921223 RepID=UPI0021662E7C|nr:cuticle protein-like [Anthonomus grandis grandis]